MPERPLTFQETLAAAIEDMLANGFDSEERIARWVRELRNAAERQIGSGPSADQMLREGLAAVYRKLVDKGGLARLSPGADRFTLERVRPALRAELDRRIMASANLIKLNRQQMIGRTLARFQGWSTSLPKGGVSRETRKEARRTIRKALPSRTFEERRVLIDQGHKLTAALSEIVATDGGAIAGRWRSHWRQPGYDYREDHKDRDGLVYLVRDSWAHRAGLARKGSPGYADEVTQPAQEPFCRCYFTWLYNLRDLPEDMLTKKGKAKLAEVRARADDFTQTDPGARADAEEQSPFEEAERLDRMGYLRGLAEVREAPDTDEWHAQYDPGTDKIVVQAKIEREDLPKQIHVLLHEAGHRGQEIDPESYQEFKRRHLDIVASFESMANQVHLREFARTGKIDGLADEVFAESYAHNALGLPMPVELRRFWRERLEAAGACPATQPESEYIAAWPNKVTRCQRCSMFVKLCARIGGNACAAVDGEISAHGHCRLFEIAGLRSKGHLDDFPKTAVPVPIDREHDVAWMFVVSRACDRLYADRTLPRQVTIKKLSFDPAELGWAHERGEWLLMMRLLAAFLEKHLREPTPAERAAIYDYAHEHGGIPAEKVRAREMRVDWASWEAWSRGQLSRLARRRIERPPPDPHVRPEPGDSSQPMESISAVA